MTNITNATASLPPDEQLACRLATLLVCEKDFNTKWTALMKTIVFQLSLYCPDCRARLAAELVEDLPDMLLYADQWAAEMADEPDPDRPDLPVCRHKQKAENQTEPTIQ
jgi:hypothetical protein